MWQKIYESIDGNFLKGGFKESLYYIINLTPGSEL